MELGTARGDDAEEHDLLSRERCSPPRARIFLVSIISFVVAALVVLLVVCQYLHKSILSCPPCTRILTGLDI